MLHFLPVCYLFEDMQHTDKTSGRSGKQSKVKISIFVCKY